MIWKYLEYKMKQIYIYIYLNYIYILYYIYNIYVVYSIIRDNSSIESDACSKQDACSSATQHTNRAAKNEAAKTETIQYPNGPRFHNTKILSPRHGKSVRLMHAWPSRRMQPAQRTHQCSPASPSSLGRSGQHPSGRSRKHP